MKQKSSLSWVCIFGALSVGGYGLRNSGVGQIWDDLDRKTGVQEISHSEAGLGH